MDLCPIGWFASFLSSLTTMMTIVMVKTFCFSRFNNLILVSMFHNLFGIHNLGGERVKGRRGSFDDTSSICSKQLGKYCLPHFDGRSRAFFR
jgi:hypothetical protein